MTGSPAFRRETSVAQWLFNPFVRLAGATALGLGLTIVVATGVVAAMAGVHLDGLLDFHPGFAVPLWVPVVEGLVNWSVFTLLVWPVSLVIAARPVRLVDIAGTQALARFPLLLSALACLPPGVRDAHEDAVAAVATADWRASGCPGCVVQQEAHELQKFLDSERSAPWLLVLMFGLAAANWPLLPDEVPIHWSSADAAPDSLGPKSFGLLFLPVFALVQYLVFRIVPAFGSSDRFTTLGGDRSNGEADDDTEADSDRYWRWMSTLLVIVLLVVYADMLISFRTFRPHPGAVIGLSLVGLGPLLRSIEPNPLFGIRTPWTMRSDRCWERTHRFAVLPTLVVGLALIGSDFLPVDLGWPAIVGAIAIWGGGLTLYSYVQWRNGAHR